ncbi:hypothetical protein SERLA73DRAFT_71331 [Serpula lacrymans var. lacrymans S7.3]|uniref:PIN domain-containing protein n=2 Tax=Serpula lacrymans var. lacrymans TaxID=341189 RepID=F8PQ88_SERL3|nr:uncharacterized protein SERLADRAFT_435577 [Serpula lacrymans var. lacrymans S7.9]EGO02189.1 hypothetical protein SERLA73DRAFT_71331 [Serpula lacrymans var. lacrymans S7.3]EGO27812.1 hypothetical protein SERLADRAFT_435577 [Serpula lacrymans var. lacrymans S7.9]
MMSTTLTATIPNAYLNATLRRIDEIANDDVEMQPALFLVDDNLNLRQSPLSEEQVVVVLDTNILLEFLEVIQRFVAESEEMGLPVLVLIPGAVIYELDGQKNRDGLAWFARRASTWLLKKVKERKSVKGQAIDETCKASGNWKTRESGELFGTERTNDSLILDCCMYFHRARPRRTFLCSKDKILCVEAESVGIPSIYPGRETFSSRDLGLAIFGQGTPLTRFSGYLPSYRDSSSRVVPEAVQDAADDDDGMDIDEEGWSASTALQPSHALDLLHLQVIEHFTRLLLELVVRVGGQEVEWFGDDMSAVSRYAPRYARRRYVSWEAADCVEYLESKKRVGQTSPRVEVFLTRPYAGAGARRGQDWSKRDWSVAMGGLRVVGGQWEDGSMRESVESVEYHMSRVFSMPMRPTGI